VNVLSGYDHQGIFVHEVSCMWRTLTNKKHGNWCKCTCHDEDPVKFPREY